MIKTSKRLQQNCLQILRDANRPMRVSEVSAIVGYSITATTAALKACGAVRNIDVFPTEWTIGDSNFPKEVASTLEGQKFTVAGPISDDIVNSWNSKCEKLGESIAKMQVTAKSDPKKLGAQLGTIAGSIAKLAYELQSVAGQPDWFQTLTEKE